MSRSGKTGPPASDAAEAVARQRRLQVILLAAFALALLGFDCLGGRAAGPGRGSEAPLPQGLRDDCSIAPDLAPFYGLAMNINRATERDLTLLPGIGPTLAGRITAKRAELGGFGHVRELRETPGIGDKTLAALAPHVCVRQSGTDEHNGTEHGSIDRGTQGQADRPSELAGPDPGNL